MQSVLCSRLHWHIFRLPDNFSIDFYVLTPVSGIRIQQSYKIVASAQLEHSCIHWALARRQVPDGFFNRGVFAICIAFKQNSNDFENFSCCIRIIPILFNIEASSNFRFKLTAIGKAFQDKNLHYHDLQEDNRIRGYYRLSFGQYRLSHRIEICINYSNMGFPVARQLMMAISIMKLFLKRFSFFNQSVIE